MHISKHVIKIVWWGFHGGAVVENLPADGGDTGSSPGLGRSYMPRSNWAREPQLLSLRIWSLCSATREATIVRGPRTAMKSGPRLLQPEKALAQKRRPNIAINQSIKKKNSVITTIICRVFWGLQRWNTCLKLGQKRIRKSICHCVISWTFLLCPHYNVHIICQPKDVPYII